MALARAVTCASPGACDEQRNWRDKPPRFGLSRCPPIGIMQSFAARAPARIPRGRRESRAATTCILILLLQRYSLHAPAFIAGAIFLTLPIKNASVAIQDAVTLALHVFDRELHRRDRLNRS